MKGTNEELGRQILKDSGLPIISADNMADAAQKIVAAVGQHWVRDRAAEAMRTPPARAERKPTGTTCRS
jgi:hypothetical protein